MVYLDSNVFVYSVIHDASKNVRARKAISILRNMEEGGIEASTSFLTWDELTWVVWKLKGRDVAIRAGATLLRLENLSLLPVNSTVMLRALELIERYLLKPRDSIHIASALTFGEKEVISDDAELDIVKEIKRRSLA